MKLLKPLKALKEKINQAFADYGFHLEEIFFSRELEKQQILEAKEAKLGHHRSQKKEHPHNLIEAQEEDFNLVLKYPDASFLEDEVNQIVKQLEKKHPGMKFRLEKEQNPTDLFMAVIQKGDQLLVNHRFSLVDFENKISKAVEQLDKKIYEAFTAAKEKVSEQEKEEEKEPSESLGKTQKRV